MLTLIADNSQGDHQEEHNHRDELDHSFACNAELSALVGYTPLQVANSLT
jgi:hypothetical protein